ncbi:MAG: NAD(P)/FAD-dependent oxidoreductase [Burkholderiales bacterium]|nr:NAD(P)/FAD-dependent oxidoreductase [Burkholderiales bacterium]
MTEHDKQPLHPEHDAAGWLAEFSTAIQRQDAAAAAELFLPDAHWRDILAFTWHFTTISGRDRIRRQLEDALKTLRPTPFRLDPGRSAPCWIERAGTSALEIFIAFDTAVGRGRGVLRLVADPGAQGRLRGWTLSTTLDELIGFEERIGARRPKGPSDVRDFGAENWLDQRRKTLAYADRDPAVMVIGGGQAGLAIAARLTQLEVDTLVIERNPRIGDNWRSRYHSLTLHNEVFVNDFPYLPFPPNWPVYISKDKLANWLEFYAEAMELNCWTGTEFVRGSYDDDAQCWNVQLRRADGTVRTMRPRHLVFAIGASPIPHVPQLPGVDAFAGTVMHSHGYTSGTAWKGRKALVLGTGTSGHDVAQDLQACGAQVTLIQRSPTYICSLKEGQRVYSLYTQGIPVDECDLLLTSLPFPVLVRSYQLSALESRRLDEKLLEGADRCRIQLDFRRTIPASDALSPARRRLLFQRRLLGPDHPAQDRAHPVQRYRALRRRGCAYARRQHGARGAAGAGHRLSQPAGSRAPAAGGCGRRAYRAGMGLRRRRRAAQHVEAHGAARSVVHCRQSRAMPHLLEVPGLADQGLRGGIDTHVTSGAACGRQSGRETGLRRIAGMT